MTIALSTLVAQLKALVPPIDGIPGDAQYESAVKQAVADFSRRTSTPTQTTISVVSGTATYTLPDDFLDNSLISFREEGDYCGDWSNWWETGYPYLGNYYGYNWYPGCKTCEERVSTFGDTLTIYPTPENDETRVLRYGRKHVLNESDEYEHLTADSEAVRILLLRAQAEATRLLATYEAAQGSKVRSYRQGDVSVDMNAQDRAKQLNAARQMLEQEYDHAVTQYNAQSGWCL